MTYAFQGALNGLRDSIHEDRQILAVAQTKLEGAIRAQTAELKTAIVNSCRAGPPK